MKSQSRPREAPKVNPECWVDEHGDCLYRYALMRVRTPETAADLVQETLLAAMRSQDRFAGRSSERSWLVGILKNKIIDSYRKLGRETTFTDMEFLSDELPAKFERDGTWIHADGPVSWTPASDEVTHSSEFWTVINRCLSKLPDRMAKVFVLREMEDVPANKLCETLNITESNLWVMLHRARMALRDCLERNWFDRETGNPPREGGGAERAAAQL